MLLGVGSIDFWNSWLHSLSYCLYISWGLAILATCRAAVAAAAERHKDPEANEADEGPEKGELWAIAVRGGVISFPCRIGACNPTCTFVIDEIHCTFTGKPPDETEQSGYIKPHIHGNLHGLGFVQTCAV